MISTLCRCSAIALLFFLACKAPVPFTKKDVIRAQKLAGLNYERSAIDVAYPYLLRNFSGYDSMRRYSLSNDVFPAVLFDPLPQDWEPRHIQRSCSYTPDFMNQEAPSDSAIAFASIGQLGHLLRSGQKTSEELTRLYIKRIKAHDGVLKSVITLLEERALDSASKMDLELAEGVDRGPLHGIPFGVKDLLALEGHKTTWGAMPYRNQELNNTAFVIKQLEEAGAILIAKLTSGALARGDVWFGGKTMSPWDTLQGASGSSAGSASATAAGLVGFSVGTETLGSITSPSHRNGVTGLRPTYGRVSRSGVMSLSWSMDKVGPICRFAEDCALVFDAIYGRDDSDPTLLDYPFCFEPDLVSGRLHVAVLKSEITKDTTDAKALQLAALEVFSSMGLEITVDSIDVKAPFAVFDIILRAESGAFFEELIRVGGVDELVQQNERSRANSLRQSRFIPAVEYLQAMRHRRILIDEMEKLFSKYDAVITPTFGRQLLITNLTGHPVVTLPIGFDKNGHPVSISVLGNLFDEATILAIAKAFQDRTSFAGRIPEGFEQPY